MKQSIFSIENNISVADRIYRMILCGDTSAITAPGQFVNIRLNGHFLRRPISVCDREGQYLTLYYKTVGAGTEQMSRMQRGDTLDLLVGLGNGYDSETSGETPVLIGGGVGVPPLYLLCKTLLEEGKLPSVVLGFNRRSEIFLAQEFRKLGVSVAVTTVDGSYGICGFVTDALPDKYSYFYACGPEPMLKAVCDATDTSGQVSFEERMGCGFGACMGCSCQTKYGSKRICQDGPVLIKEEILW